MRAGPQRDVDYGSAVLTRVAPSALIAIVARPRQGRGILTVRGNCPLQSLDFVLARPEEIVRSGSNSEVRVRNWAVRFTLKNRRRQPGLSGPKSANNGSEAQPTSALVPWPDTRVPLERARHSQ